MGQSTIESEKTGEEPNPLKSGLKFF